MASDRDRNSDDRSSGHESKHGGHESHGSHDDHGSHDKDRNSGRGSDSKSSGTSKRGFASMDENKQREIASKGGHAAHEKGTAHEFTSEEAREAGRKGGHAAHEKGTAHEFTSEEAREAGRKGGHAAHEKGTAHEFSWRKLAKRAGKVENHPMEVMDEASPTASLPHQLEVETPSSMQRPAVKPQKSLKVVLGSE